MSFRNNTVKIAAGFLGLALLVVPQFSYAYWGVGIDVNVGAPRYNYYYHYAEHPQWGWHVHYLPAGHVTCVVHGVRYHYFDGLYYRYVGPNDYVLVQPPVGVYVSALPAAFQPVIINGRTYYTDNGAYYVLTQYHGYKLVAPPRIGVAPYPGAVWVPGYYGPYGGWHPGHWARG